MKKWTKKELLSEGYEIENMQITSADLKMNEYGCLIFPIVLKGTVGGLVYGSSYCLGNGYVGAKEFIGSSDGEEAIMRIMDTVGCNKFSDLKGSYVRIALKDNVGRVIGNIIDDKWFDDQSFFDDKRNESQGK